MNATHSKRRSDQMFKMSSTSFHTSSSLKNMKSKSDAGNDVAVFVREFDALHSLQQWVLAHDASLSISTSKWWIPVFLKILPVVLWLFGAPSWIKINSLTESMFSSVRAPRRRPLPWRVLVLPVCLNFLLLIQTRNRPTFAKKFSNKF